MSEPIASGASVGRRLYCSAKYTRKPCTIRNTAMPATDITLKSMSMSTAWFVASGNTPEIGVTIIHQLVNTQMTKRMADTREMLMVVSSPLYDAMPHE